ncbi:BTAD domain-containing putative transcriptional regulator [Streptomyces sp. NPDC059009]|uniref:AfsR/SARP family transcriptional regulator n=1 Tax=Streptomyces sp. NPDC059009 TaxID=3346694 RepID=UPI0036B77E29
MQRKPVEAGPSGVPAGAAPAGAPGSPGLRIGVLGPLELHSGGADRTPSAPMARRLLAVLLLHANHAVPVTALVDELWDGTAPRRARQAVQTYVYQLRQALGQSPQSGAGIETRPGGYLLRLRPGQLDLWAFQHAVAGARQAQERDDDAAAARSLRTALDLWRGPAFAGLEAGPLLAARIAQLDDARLGALEQRIAADLRLGRHRAVLGELAGLTLAHPGNEEFTAQLMTAAHRAGHRATALDAFRRLRGNLVGELGIEPSQRLRALHQDVLTQAPALDLPVPDDRGPSAHHPTGTRPDRPPLAHLPADTADFTGRADELRRVLDLGRTGRPGAAPTVITLNGTAGSGKTTLAVHAAHALKEHFPDGQLYAVLHDADDRPLDPADVLRALLHDTGMRPEDIPEAAEGRARAFRTWSAGRALLILLDDAAGADQVLPLLPGSGRSTVLITSRVRLGGLPGARLLQLGPPAAADALRLLTGITEVTDRFDGLGAAADADADDDEDDEGEDEVEAMARIVRLCGRLPLAVRAAGEKLAARRMWGAAALARRLEDEHRRLTELRSDVFDIQARLEGALHRLPAADRRSLWLLAGTGPVSFGPRTAARALGTADPETERVLGALLDQHALELVGPRHDLRFRIPELLRLTALATGGAGTPGRALVAVPDVPDDRCAAAPLPVRGPGVPSRTGRRGSAAAARTRALAGA